MNRYRLERLAGHLSISNKLTGNLSAWELTEPQKLFLEAICNNKRVIALKSRQVYFSTVGIFALMCFAIQNENVNCAIIADTQSNAEGLLARIREVWLPQLDISKLPRDQHRTLQLPNGSKIEARTIASKAGQVSRLGRSNSYQFVLITELGVLTDVVAEPGWVALQAAIEHAHVIIESTGTNQGKLFKSLFCQDNDYHKLFVGVEDHPHYKMDSYEETPAETRLKGELGFTDDLAANWWLYQLKNRYNNDISKCLQELPILPEHAFYSTDGAWFSTTPTYSEGAIQQIYAAYTCNVYRASSPIYYYGIDVAKGVGGDYSATIILDKNHQIVATFDNNQIDTITYLELLKKLFERFPPHSVAVDSIGVGTTLYQSLVQMKAAQGRILEITSTESHKYNTLLNARNYLVRQSEVPKTFKRDIESLHVNKAGKFTGYKDCLMALGYALEVAAKFPYIPPAPIPQGFQLRKAVRQSIEERLERESW
jgi:hypothetical protein